MGTSSVARPRRRGQLGSSSRPSVEGVTLRQLRARKPAPYTGGALQGERGCSGRQTSKALNGRNVTCVKGIFRERFNF